MSTSVPSTAPVRIHVHHPASDAEIVLRTSLDWDRDVRPVEVDPSGVVRTFEIATGEPYLYYKAVRLGGGEAGTSWAAGPNRLATSGASRDFDAFPYFDPSGARLSELQEVAGEAGTWRVRVFLPPGYDENTLHRYPVLYMMDGHNLFDPAEAAMGQEWDVQDTLRQLDRMTSIEQVIVVGVYPGDRMQDYTSAGGAAHRRFLADDLVPHVDRTFRTLPGPARTAILGSSLGGVAAFESAWERPDRFGMVGALSATFGYDDDLARRVTAGPRPDLRVYLDSGWPRDNFEVTRDMRARLAGVGFVEGVDLLYFAFPGARHDEASWGDRVHLPFQFFFGHGPEERSLAGAHAAGAESTVAG